MKKDNKSPFEKAIAETAEQSKEETVKQEKSAEAIVNKSDIAAGLFDILGDGSGSTHDECKRLAVECCLEYAKPFQQRIAELEAELKRKDEALRVIIAIENQMVFGHKHEAIVRIAEQALKPKA